MSEDQKIESGNLIGKELDGKYFIVRALGKGAMGVVYEALHTGIDRKLAVKVLNPDVAGDEEVLERFKREARLTGKLGHENIIEITDTGKTPTGSPYLVMEFLDGRSLGQTIFADGPLSPEFSIGILAYVLDALAVVHDAGVLHRDLKPDNIFLSEQGRPGKRKTVVKLLDFGISKPLDTSLASGALTQTGVIMGTPYYMAPEQVRGKELDPRADLYALGVILYEMLTTHLPFTGDSFGDLFAAILTIEPPSPSELVAGIPKELDAVVMRTFAREKKDRYRTADELMMALEPFGPRGLIARLCDSRGVDLKTVPEYQSHPMAATEFLPEEPKKGNKALLAALVIVAVIMLGLVGFLAFRGLGGESALPATTGESSSAEVGERQEPEPAAVSPTSGIQLPSIEMSQAVAAGDGGAGPADESATSGDSGAEAVPDAGATADEPEDEPDESSRDRGRDRVRRDRGDRPSRPHRPRRPPLRMEIDTSLPPPPPRRVPIREIDVAPPSR